MSFGRRSDGRPLASGREISSTASAPRPRENVVAFADAGHVDPDDGSDPRPDPEDFAEKLVAEIENGNPIEGLPRGEVANLVTQTAEKAWVAVTANSIRSNSAT